ncbi:hydrogenase expression/synthesis, HypA [Staphylothermus marinus F1]|uniref:Hydrogenase maturation factor HypA n=1 Tax=Staphylothermus marinus (strain ATCC 43588 / DSM 3639 / JCM 9404 / F1) TaxID=399550 RepID=A3DKY0_STAMF|nr:hydrogenase nickel incorporation protein HypA [Staphylothermus marinus]ABN69290.1 hydrogenase expression/synthesis, HypA [Staphylothermus marinus F1]
MVHEWALAEALLDYVENYAKQKGINHVKRLVVKLGVLQSIDKEILSFSLNQLLSLRDIVIDKIDLIDEPVVLKCRRCGYEWSPKMDDVDESIREAIHFVPETVYSFFKCPRCGSRDFEIVKGRGVEIDSIELGEEK